MAAGVVTATVNSAVSRTGIDGRAAGRQKSVPCLQHPGPAGLHRRREEITTGRPVRVRDPVEVEFGFDGTGMEHAAVGRPRRWCLRTPGLAS
jgi:hypothetical protein